MVDLKEKNTNNLESEQQIELNETHMDLENLEETNVNTDSTNIEVSTESDNIENKIADSNSDISNCLALTVKKDYNLVIAKNVVLKTLKSTWKIVLSIFTLNFLKFFL